ncbi:hypothetical protein K402DRAFT_358191 [Aulographum hederae CBS 113979]|uniref:Nucleotide-diphospho-sugar transferase domain-containing protein n=1 Tax=Aulographum hederae CBS 113979 TaxID=1176131 RepID=A0A6G1GWB9_9PEZI|nr:hypothetical protein K402DRAFT_358191 [Aulographum hederae CBS 113979]
MDQPNQIWADEPFDWYKLEGVSPGMLNHYLYAMIHGYDYKFIRTHDFLDRNAYWTKIPAMADILHSYDIVIIADADVTFPHMHLPFEWLMNRWNYTKGMSFMQTVDPDWGSLQNSFGRVNGNAGFITLQNNKVTHEMLRKWHHCPDDPDHFPNCDRFRDGFPAEQGAFGEFLRYEYAEYVREVDCDEAMGFPEFGNGCIGRFVRHYTVGKDRVKDAIAKGVVQGFFNAIEYNMKERESEIVSERLSNDIMIGEEWDE